MNTEGRLYKYSSYAINIIILLHNIITLLLYILYSVIIVYASSMVFSLLYSNYVLVCLFLPLKGGREHFYLFQLLEPTS
jgi:hypothetical protein